MTTVISIDQSFLDIALQQYGSLEAIMEMALLNGLSISEDIEAGSELQTPAQEKVIVLEVVSFYMSKNIKPATAITAAQSQAINPQGISYWAINIDFKVS